MGEASTERLRALFVAALETPSEEREAFFESLDTADRSEVEALMAAHDSNGSFLAVPPLAALAGLQRSGQRSATELQLGDRIDDYRVVGVLGRGGSGTVFRAQQLALGREVALKVISTAEMSGRDRDRARRELRVVAHLQAPHLVTVFAGGEDESRRVLWYAMRLVEGVELSVVLGELLRRGRPPNEDERRALVQRVAEVARALGVLHDRGLVHRDVKPANIVLEAGGVQRPGSGSAVLVDLGLVRPVAATSLATAAGTLLYMAPESLQLRRVGPAADVFALGVVLLDLLSAQDPSRRVPGQQPKSVRATGLVDADLDAVIAMATMERPGWRHSDGAALAADLEAWLEGRPVMARQTASARRPVRWLYRHRVAIARRTWWLAARGAVCVVVLFAITWVAQTWNAVERARTAWSSGDLAALHASLTSIPSLALDLLPVATLRHRRPGPPAGPVDDVMRHIGEHGEAGAVKRAACYLERDGSETLPRLAAFVARALGEGGAVGEAALDSAARLFFERPDRRPQAVAASRPVRAALLRRLGPDAPPLALTALAGCGDAGTVDALAAWLGMHGRQASADTVRLAYRALAAIVYRAEACGFGPELLALDQEVLLARAAAALPEAEPEARAALESLAVSLALVARRAKRVPPPAEALRQRGVATPFLLAARADPSAAASVLSFPAGPYAGGVDPPTVYQLGFHAGVLGDSVVTDEVRVRVDDFATAHGLAPATCRAMFDHGLREGAATFRGDTDPFNSDPESRLRAELAPAAIALLDVRHDVLGAAIASWRFGAPTPLLGAGAQSARLRAATWRPDPSVGGANHVRLLPLTTSSLELELVVEGTGAPAPVVHLTVQKGMRPLLPDAGTARLELRFDGEILARACEIPSLGIVPLSLPLPPLRPGARHRLDLHLADGSSTTLRVHDVIVRIP